MTLAQPFEISYSPEADEILDELDADGNYRAKVKKIKKAIRLLKTEGPGYPSLRTHEYQSVAGPDGEKVWQSYVENDTPAAWRMWWIYGPGENEITILSLGKHP